ncbi:hypothetical protein SISSUDRAFT_361296 [Sistotremastrum suecicum HHB10207 ss-3]|uniref:F-box domain-containing protein n=1 Tax=Sistotremastrum suecicum HHB10207 ss-3 TaxID=1314776 RepID=A0A165Z5W1_9AGAM|nr:hypothetical protein SISSUDRAFT_361296 [Sistotremastrum suecicum HHB10207 ss-3]
MMDALPTELILKIWQKMTVADLISLSQTCSAFRSMVLDYRALLASSPDAYIIPLPIGYSLSSVDAPALHARACQAVALSKRVHEATSLLPCSGFTTLPSIWRASAGSVVIGCFLYDYILLLSYSRGEARAYDIQSLECLFSAGPIEGEVVYASKWQLSESRSEIIQAELACRFDGDADLSLLRVYRLTFSFSEGQRQRLIWREELRVVSIPSASEDSMTLNGPLIFITYWDSILIYDWEKETAVFLSFFPGFAAGISRFWVEPNNGTLIMKLAGYSGPLSTIPICTYPIPSGLRSFDPSQVTTLPKQLFEPCFIPEIAGFDKRLWKSVGLRRLPSNDDPLFVLDILHPLTATAQQPPHPYREASSTLVSLSLEDWRPIRDPHTIRASPGHLFVPILCDSSASTPLPFRQEERHTKARPEFLRLTWSETTAERNRWIKLKFPPSLTRKACTILGFDQTTGRLLVNEKNDIHILRY